MNRAAVRPDGGRESQVVSVREEESVHPERAVRNLGLEVELTGKAGTKGLTRHGQGVHRKELLGSRSLEGKRLLRLQKVRRQIEAPLPRPGETLVRKAQPGLRLDSKRTLRKRLYLRILQRHLDKR